MRAKNIIELYFDNDKQTPFVVRRENWSESFTLLVVSVRPAKHPTGWYGLVYGFALPCRDQNPYWGLPGEPVEVPNAGSYQWYLVPTSKLSWEDSQWVFSGVDYSFD